MTVGHRYPVAHLQRQAVPGNINLFQGQIQRFQKISDRHAGDPDATPMEKIPNSVPQPLPIQPAAPQARFQIVQGSGRKGQEIARDINIL